MSILTHSRYKYIDMNEITQKKLVLYQMTAVFSVIFALAGFSYNVWRMEISEKNSNIRTACFEILMELAELEQLIYTAVYDRDIKEGSPRKGWVKVGLINDLSTTVSADVQNKGEALRATWADNWNTMLTDTSAAEKIVRAIEDMRKDIKIVLVSLE